MKKALYVGLIVECLVLLTASLEAQLSKCYTLYVYGIVRGTAK